jgi:hypothetical protein
MERGCVANQPQQFERAAAGATHTAALRGKYFWLHWGGRALDNLAGNGVCRPVWENRLVFSADDSYE